MTLSTNYRRPVTEQKRIQRSQASAVAVRLVGYGMIWIGVLLLGAASLATVLSRLLPVP